jgi:transcriptional repressor NrdR
MRCPYCNYEETKVTNKRDIDNGTRRRRECLKCGKRFTTHETLEPIDIIVVKKDGRREPFLREKLKSGIVKACEKRPVSIEQIEKVVNEIEEKLAKKGKEVSSKMVGEYVIMALKKLDKIAYIRFASVYREFKDINDFKNAVKEI